MMSENAPHVSILIPLLNEEALVWSCAEAWRGIIAELGCECELLFIDDGSTDATPQRLEELQCKHAFIRSIRNDGLGQHQALAAGIAAARGRIIVTGDADLFPDPSDLIAAIRLAEDGDGALVVMKRRLERSQTRRIYSLLNNGLLSLLSGRNYGDIGSMQMCFPAPQNWRSESTAAQFYLPLKLETQYRRREIPARFSAAERPSRYSLKKLARLLSIELHELGDLPDNRHPHLLTLLDATFTAIFRK